VSVEFEYDDNDVQVYLARFRETQVKAVLRKAASAAGRAGKPILLSSYQSQPHPYSNTGNLEHSIGYGRIRSPQTIGVVIAALRRKGRLSKSTGKRVGQKRGQARHLVEYGTKPHLIPPRKSGYGLLLIALGGSHYIHHTGAKPKPFLGPVVDTISSASSAAAERVILGYVE
jgi:hypothetical protein